MPAKKKQIDPSEWATPTALAQRVEGEMGIKRKTVQWWISNRRNNGLEGAVRRSGGGRLLLVHLPTFYQWLAADDA